MTSPQRPVSVLLLTRYPRLGPSSRVRHYAFLPALERAGFAVTSAPLLDDASLAATFAGRRRGSRALISAYARRLAAMVSARRYDLIWVEKEALPWLPASIERALIGRRPLVVDFDDPWHLRYAAHSSALVRALLGGKLEAVVARADVVTVGSAMLQDWAAKAGARRLVELPPVVELERYPVRPLPPGPFTLGWIGTPANEPYLKLIAEPLRRLAAAREVRLRLIGGSGRLALAGVCIEQVPWREDEEAAALAACHVGVMPLSDGPWERGKCGYKLVQYMAAGRAAIASPVGAATALVVPGVTGLIAAGDQDWLEALLALAEDRERARAMGLAARERAQAHYSLAAAAPRLIALFHDALAGKVAA
jgi:glycosyltransferase involved in cell wall biosynthesis